MSTSRVFSTLGDHDACGGCHEYIGEFLHQVIKYSPGTI